jgi:hypothetical protein
MIHKQEVKISKIYKEKKKKKGSNKKSAGPRPESPSFNSKIWAHNLPPLRKAYPWPFSRRCLSSPVRNECRFW